MVNLSWIANLGAIVGGSWLASKPDVFKLGEDADAVADLLRRERRAEAGRPQQDSDTKDPEPPA
jgi:hypothetical protein